jgi:hypothetical protein
MPAACQRVAQIDELHCRATDFVRAATRNNPAGRNREPFAAANQCVGIEFRGFTVKT